MEFLAERMFDSMVFDAIHHRKNEEHEEEYDNEQDSYSFVRYEKIKVFLSHSFLLPIISTKASILV